MSEPLRRTVTVRCPPEHAFEVFTARLDLWWPRGHRKHPQSKLLIEGHQGGRFFEAVPTGEERLLGEVLRWQPPTRLTYTWVPGGGAGPTEVDISFVAEGEYTRVEVVHAEADSGLGEAWNERIKKFTWAWGEVLPAFAAYLEE